MVAVNEVLRVLCVEDSPTDAKLVIHELKRLGRPIESERVETAEAMAEALSRARWDLVLSDWSMPAFRGDAALAVLKAASLDVPFIIVSGTVGEEHAVDAMRAGAHDYVLKGQLSRLVPAVERELREHALRAAHREEARRRRQAESHFDRLFRSGIGGITILSADGTIVEANDTFLAMLGYDRAALDARQLDWRALTPSDWRELADRAFAEVERGGTKLPYEKEFFHKDGRRVPVTVGLARLDDGRVLTMVTDLSERKAAEVQALSLQEQLRQSQKMEAIGRLAGGIAHDFNNLLSVVLSYSEMLLADLRPGDPLAEDVAEIFRAGSRAADLTRQLLLFSRQQVVEPKLLDLDTVLGGLDKMLRRIVGEDVALTTNSNGSLDLVRIDPGSLEQVVMNLVVNARDAMPTGGKLTIETANVTLDAAYLATHHGAALGPHVMLSVTDTGSGMDARTKSRIFEPFFTTKSLAKGTGLGLSTVLGIIQQAGGTVWVYSEPGLGTSFKVYLPKAEGESAAPRPAPVVESLRGSETILLVEDEDQVRDVARTILERHGYTIIEADSAEVALSLLPQVSQPIHLLLSDVVLPGMSGAELAKQIALLRPETRILCMCGYTDDAAVRHGVVDAELAYLQKPLTVELLARKVREVLDDSTPRRA